jgi:hypothetical protein
MTGSVHFGIAELAKLREADYYISIIQVLQIVILASRQINDLVLYRKGLILRLRLDPFMCCAIRTGSIFAKVLDSGLKSLHLSLEVLNLGLKTDGKFTSYTVF